jgi:7-cyano-7-deazaguanine synthase
MKVLAVVSGGLDSTTLMYDLLSGGDEVQAISFNYGQRHKRELVYAAANCKALNIQHDIIDLRTLTEFLSNSALTSNKEIEVPEGHYAEDNMKQTVVPNRNMIMLSIATGIAINRGLNTVATAVHAGDHFVYPDCRPEFIFSLGQAILDGNQGFHNFFVEDIEPIVIGDRTYSKTAKPLTTPYIHQTKEEIAVRALELGVPLHLTWSCYKGGDQHCGRCGTCVERLEAIHNALITWNAHTSPAERRYDATPYEDEEYWKVVVGKTRVETTSDVTAYEEN